jgi:sarcosine oxidase, subunit delta
MLILDLPLLRRAADETELTAGGEAHLKRFGPGSSDEAFDGYMFAREEPQGRAFRTLAACLWLRQMVSGRALHR